MKIHLTFLLSAVALFGPSAYAAPAPSAAQLQKKIATLEKQVKALLAKTDTIVDDQGDLEDQTDAASAAAQEAKTNADAAKSKADLTKTAVDSLDTEVGAIGDATNAVKDDVDALMLSVMEKIRGDKDKVKGTGSKWSGAVYSPHPTLGVVATPCEMTFVSNGDGGGTFTSTPFHCAVNPLSWSGSINTTVTGKYKVEGSYVYFYEMIEAAGYNMDGFAWSVQFSGNIEDTFDVSKEQNGNARALLKKQK